MENRRRKRQRYKAPAAQARKRQQRGEARGDAGGKSGGRDGDDDVGRDGTSTTGGGGGGGQEPVRGRVRPASLTDVKGGAAFFFMCAAGSEKRTGGQMRDWIEEIVESLEDAKEDDDGTKACKEVARDKPVDVQRELQAELDAFKTQIPLLQSVALVSGDPSKKLMTQLLLD
ncbi:Hypothetical Protein FCC1311_010232 [Hondaea fermentalgiana]|uniref:Uncharacterized protein n=1 Tax=Hondaea fermentalgiana TaxID=2315210 RepID=A0A2R5G2P1_9STRA|nr:Hypothetical Protein FCC1311_010232 [Hondaea fermentalgiana]|eukprot:GBG24805.1 Hypothetical Protein FCC1311_010232 [Hondaea fermentalgiana]